MESSGPFAEAAEERIVVVEHDAIYPAVSPVGVAPASLYISPPKKKPESGSW
jgi:hypothetical protein